MGIAPRHALIAAVLALTLSACSGAKPTATPSSPTTAPEPPAAPAAKACYDLPFQAALQPTNDAHPVSCTARHTAETLYVGRIDPLVDGHLLAVDSGRLQKQIAQTCRDRLAQRVGGSDEVRRLSRLQSAWFGPTLAQSEAGALWYRCDLVFVVQPEQLAALPRNTHGLLAAANALDTYGTCGTASPSSPSFQRVACGRPHSWRARASIDLAGGSYPGPKTVAAATSQCRDLDAKVAANNLKLMWSFESPTPAQWKAGQRYGFCWTPDPA